MVARGHGQGVLTILLRDRRCGHGRTRRGADSHARERRSRRIPHRTTDNRGGWAWRLCVRDSGQECEGEGAADRQEHANHGTILQKQNDTESHNHTVDGISDIKGRSRGRAPALRRVFAWTHQRPRGEAEGLRNENAVSDDSKTASEIADLLRYFGGRQEDRTPDLRIANAALSQLS